MGRSPMVKTTGDIFEETCPECNATFKGLTEKQAKSQLTQHMEKHESDEEEEF